MAASMRGRGFSATGGGAGGGGALLGPRHGPRNHAAAARPPTRAVPVRYASARDFFWPVTVTVAVALAPSHVHVSVAMPGLIAVTRPFCVTVATSVSVEAQVMVQPMSVAPLALLGRPDKWTAPWAATVTCAAGGSQPTTPVVRPGRLRPMGV